MKSHKYDENQKEEKKLSEKYLGRKDGGSKASE